MAAMDDLGLTDQLRRRAVDQGWPLDGWHAGIRVEVAGGLDAAGGPGGVDAAALRRDVLAALHRSGVGQALAVEHGDGIAAWLTSRQQPTAQQVVDVARRLRGAQRHLRGIVPSRMGVGSVHRGPDGLAQSMSEAADAARLASNRAESGYVVHVDRLGLAQLLLAWTATDTFTPAAAALLRPLIDVPGDLVATLAAYLDCESSVVEAAAILGVHRNTVAARIARIEELLDVDLGNGDDRLALHLACRSIGGQP